ncbi:hypothetical protein [Dolichospermum circinale]|uniref:hypothetical protein n=1 Tax=Dolichospermum circinale TaxID=109265 RepID=UPI0004827781|nr:hypothetical protein [Dolichospermum circinale]MDB9474427.1 hypothetical protein [Dolichospermum circinale CS-537/11]MDB9478794.1 hypothetical protein [Dolichospermum circinale CS-537/03]MDB9482915.1 hypothetical protein [Dolichospermum circinale CS-537/05]
MLRIFSTHRLFAFLLIGLMITSCGGGTSSNTPSTGTSSGTSNNTSGGGTTSGGSTSGGGTSNLAEKAEMEWQLYQSDCSSAGPIPAKTFSDGSRGRCTFGVPSGEFGNSISRPRAFRD